MADPTPKQVNNAFVGMLEQGMEKQAQDAVNDYIRVRMREDGFHRRILPPVQITNDELDRQVDTDKPVKVVDKEPQSPGAISVPFATQPINRYIRGPRFRVMFDRILTPRFTKDIDELRTYDMDIRQILSDNSIKDMLAEEDGKFILVCNTLLVSQGGTVPETGTIQWRNVGGGVTRDTIAESMKILPSTPNHLNPSTVLVNNVTIWDVVKWGRDEAGGDLSQDLLERGFAEREIMGVRWLITTNRKIVPTGTFFMFAKPAQVGLFCTLEEITAYVERLAYHLDFLAYESVGAVIMDARGIARVDFTDLKAAA